MSVAIESAQGTKFDKEKHDRQFDDVASGPNTDANEVKAENKCAWTTCFTTA